MGRLVLSMASRLAESPSEELVEEAFTRVDHKALKASNFEQSDRLCRDPGVNRQR